MRIGCICMNKEDSRKGMGIYIAVLFILLVTIIVLVVLVLVLLNNKVESKNDNNNAQITEKQERKEDISKDNIFLSNVELNKISSNIELVSKYFGRWYPLNDVKEIDNQKMLEFMFIHSNCHCSVDDERDVYNLAELNNYISNLFYDKLIIGEDFKFAGGCGTGIMYKYDRTTDSFILNKDYCGIELPFMDKINVDILGYDFIDDDTIEFKTKLLYDSWGYRGYYDADCGYYASFEDSLDKKNVLISKEYVHNSEHCPDFTNEEYESVKNKLPITTFVLKKVNNNYLIQSVKVS